jgi:glutaredoxin
MIRLFTALALASFLAASPVMAWDPVSVFNSAVQGQVNRQIYQGVSDLFRSIEHPNSERRQDNARIPDAGDGRIVLYGTAGCGYCRQARQHMDARGIAFVDKDPQLDSGARAEFNALGGRGVPLILMGEQKLTGFSPASFDAAYAKFQAGQPSAADARAGQASVAGARAGQPSAAGAQGDVLVARIARVKIMNEAHARARVAGQLAKGEEVIFLGETRNGYARVKSAETEGWAEQDLLAKP